MATTSNNIAEELERLEKRLNQLDNDPVMQLIHVNYMVIIEEAEKREKIQALSLAKECYSMKLDLLTNATVVEDVIGFVSSNVSKDKETAKKNEEAEDKTIRCFY